MIYLDGNYLEGGGQIARTALALSTLTKQPFEVKDIRKGRKQPGLKNQHLYCIKALQELCNADVEGAELGSDHLKFTPKDIKAKDLTIDIGTAGSITLLLQSLLLPCFFLDKKIKLNIKGGSDTQWSMPWDYFTSILLPIIKKYANIDAKLINRGYYPKGQGEVEIKINPAYRMNNFNDFDGLSGYLRKENKKIELTEQGSLVKINGISHASKFLEKAEVAERQARSAKLILNRLNCPVNIQAEYNNAACPGSGITLWAAFSSGAAIGADSLGELGKKAELVGQEAANSLIKEINQKAPVDNHLADNLVPWLALFGGKIKTTEITNHTLTNIYVVEKFLGNIFEINKKESVINII